MSPSSRSGKSTSGVTIFLTVSRNLSRNMKDKTEDIKLPSKAAMNVAMTTGKDTTEDMMDAVLEYPDQGKKLVQNTNLSISLDGVKPEGGRMSDSAEGK